MHNITVSVKKGYDPVLVFEQQTFPYQWLLVINMQLLECKLCLYIMFVSVILLPAQKELEPSAGDRVGFFFNMLYLSSYYSAL